MRQKSRGGARKITALVVAGLLLTFGKLCLAEEKDPKEVSHKFGVGAYGLMALPRLENFGVNGGGGVLAKYVFSDSFALGTEVEYSRWHFSTTSSDGSFTGTLEGDLNVIPWTLTAYWLFSDAEKVSIYFGGGLTVVFISNNATGVISPGGNATVNFDPAPGAHLLWGLDWFLNNHWALNGNMKLTFASSTTSETVETGSITADDANMTNVAVRMGLSYFF